MIVVVTENTPLVKLSASPSCNHHIIQIAENSEHFSASVVIQFHSRKVEKQVL